MEGRDAFSRRCRVAVVSHDPALGADLAGLCAARVELVRLHSGYEAAAEILAAPVAALVIDFRAMARPHPGLLDIARRMNVEMFAVGALPAQLSADDLSRVRLISRADLAGQIAQLAAASAPPPAAAAPEPPAAAAEAPRPEPVGATPGDSEQPSGHATAATKKSKSPSKASARPRKRAKAARKPRSGARRKKPIQLPEAEPPPPAAPPEPPAQPRAQPRAPSDLLTPEELAALLENEA